MSTLSSRRSALLHALLPSPGGGLPAASELDLREFWPRFEKSAPRSLELGFDAAAALLYYLPLGLGYRRTLDALSDDEREEVLERATKLPGVDALLDVAKVVVCFAYFDDPEVEARVRGKR